MSDKYKKTVSEYINDFRAARAAEAGDQSELADTAGSNQIKKMKIDNMMQLFAVGERIYGYCNGLFGRDSYGDQTCMSVTPKYAVFEDDKGFADVLNWSEDLPKTVEKGKWKDPAESYS